MNRNLKILGLTLVAVIALGALTAGAAQAAAPRWKVEGEFLGFAEARTFNAASTAQSILATPALGVTFESPLGKCTSNGEIEGSPSGLPGTAEATLTCTQVVVQGAPLCKVKSPGQLTGTVKTNTLVGTLVWLKEAGGEAGVRFKPANGGPNFVVIEVEGCAAAGLYPVTKEVIGKLAPVEMEVETGTLDFPSSPILESWSNSEPRLKIWISRLAVKSQPATFDTTFNIALSPEEAVGVFPG